MLPRRRPYQPINAEPRSRLERIGDIIAMTAVVVALMILFGFIGYTSIANHF